MPGPKRCTWTLSSRTHVVFYTFHTRSGSRAVSSARYLSSFIYKIAQNGTEVIKPDPTSHSIPNRLWNSIGLLTKRLSLHFHALLSILLREVVTPSHILVHQRPVVVSNNISFSKPHNSKYSGLPLHMNEQRLLYRPLLHFAL